MQNFKALYTYRNELKKDHPQMTDFEALSLAIQMQRNDILTAALALPQNDSRPGALETIAIQLGAKPNGRGNSLTTEIGLLAEVLKRQR